MAKLPVEFSERREKLGRLVREVWVEWAREQPAAPQRHLVPWEECSEGTREVDMRIGERLAQEGYLLGIAVHGVRGVVHEPNEPIALIREAAINAVRAELVRAMGKFPPFHSMHEGWAVIHEELDEMWDEIKANRKGRAREEAVQVAAMAVRFLVDFDPYWRENEH